MTLQLTKLNKEQNTSIWKSISAITDTTAIPRLRYSSPIAQACEIEILCPFLLHQRIGVVKVVLPCSEIFHLHNLDSHYCNSFQACTFTCTLGNWDVRRVSWVSSPGLRLGMLKTRADWSQVAAVDVIRYPLSHRLWMPSLGYMKSSSTTWKIKIISAKGRHVM